MTLDKEPAPRAVGPAEDEDEDVEGNSLLIGSTMTSDLARIRSRDIEREARERARAKEAKGDKPR
jgi:hypothetical protein